MLTTEDPVERLLLQALAMKAKEVSEMHDENQAIRIANAVAKMLNG